MGVKTPALRNARDSGFKFFIEKVVSYYFHILMTKTHSKEIIVDGKTYNSLRRAAETYGLNYCTVWTRLKSGKTVMEAFKKKESEKYKKKISVNGKKYPSIRQAAIAFGLEPRTIWSRLEKSKSLKEVFSIEKLKKIGNAKRVNIRNRSFASAQDAADFYEIII